MIRNVSIIKKDPSPLWEERRVYLHKSGSNQENDTKFDIWGLQMLRNVSMITGGGDQSRMKTKFKIIFNFKLRMHKIFQL